tara:strand:- start:4864 stop:5232 length:369 start_codon:yes stop_codon:yes gene_type:complete
MKLTRTDLESLVKAALVESQVEEGEESGIATVRTQLGKQPVATGLASVADTWQRMAAKNQPLLGMEIAKFLRNQLKIDSAKWAQIWDDVKTAYAGLDREAKQKSEKPTVRRDIEPGAHMPRK